MRSKIVALDDNLTAYTVENPDGSIGFDPSDLNGLKIMVNGVEVILFLEHEDPTLTFIELSGKIVLT